MTTLSRERGILIAYRAEPERRCARRGEMLIRKKPSGFAVLLVIAMFLLQNCATIVRGTSQKIPVTSAPAGAKVLLDGKDMGTTPLELKLKKRKPGVIRIEKEGYNPHEIRITQIKPPRFDVTQLANASVGVLVASAIAPKLINREGEFFKQLGNLFLYGVLIACAVAIPLSIVDYSTRASYSLDPESVDVVLTATEGTPRLEVTEIDEGKLRDVKWLRIRVADLRDRH
jgi:hypothetical protein